MRVICIDNSAHIATDMPKIPEGEVVTVVGSTEYNGFMFYLIAEYLAPRPLNWWYWKEQFIPCSDIDETELVNELQTSLTV